MLLSHLDPLGDPQTLVGAVESIIQRAQARNLPRSPWSLCELETDAADHVWLCQWALNLEASTVQTWLASQRPYTPNEWGITRQAAFGLLFLLFAAEAARRDATEGHLWTFVCKDTDKKLRFTPDVDILLFVQGQPCDELKQAIEKAARTFNLRHVFGISGLMNWFTSVFLQFGFTRRGFMARLPFWLAGYGASTTIEALLAGDRCSPGFVTVWMSLQELRRGNIKPDTFLQRAHGSPWLLPEWREELCRQAKRRPDLGTSATAKADGDLPATAIPFVAAPMLRWAGAERPVFVTHVQNLSELELEEADYTLMVGEQECATLIRQPDGAYAVLPGGDIVLPLLAPTLAVSLVRPDGATAQTQTLTLFDPAEEVTAFRYPAGTRLDDAWTAPLNQNTDLLLLLSPDLTLTPAPSRWASLSGIAACVYHLAAGWSSEVSVQLEGEAFWKPVLTQGPASAEPAWARAVQAKWERAAHVRANVPGVAVDDAMAWLRVDCPAGAQIAWVRAGGGMLASTPPSSVGHVFYGPIRLFEDCPRRRITIRVEHEENGVRSAMVIVRSLYTISAGVQGAVRQTAEGWIAMGAGTRLSVREAQMQPVRLLPPSKWGQADTRGEFGLIEGQAWMGSAARSTRPLGRLGGWGARLELRPRPYNSAGECLLLASEVYDTGNVANVVVHEETADSRVVRVHLHQRTEPDEQFQVIWWDVNGTLAIVNGDAVTVQEDGSWQCAVCGELSAPLAVGLAYDGVRRGAWWREDWACHLEALAAANPLQTAALLRYFKLPLCARSSLPYIITLSRRSPGKTLEAWLTPQGLPEGFRQQQDVDWNPTLRIIFSDWMPDRHVAARLLHLLKGDKDGLITGLLAVAERLTAICPVLMARVFLVFRDDILPTQNPPMDSRAVIGKVCHRLAGLRPDADSAGLEAKKRELVTTASEMLGMGIVNAVNPAFVSSKQGGLVEKATDLFEGRPILQIQQSNLDIAFATVEPLRRLVAITLLQHLTK